MCSTRAKNRKTHVNTEPNFCPQTLQCPCARTDCVVIVTFCDGGHSVGIVMHAVGHFSFQHVIPFAHSFVSGAGLVIY